MSSYTIIELFTVFWVFLIASIGFAFMQTTYDESNMKSKKYFIKIVKNSIKNFGLIILIMTVICMPIIAVYYFLGNI